MRFRNSTRLLTENFKNVYKILLYTLAVALVAIALSCTFLLPNLLEILDSMEMTAVVSDLKEFLNGGCWIPECLRSSGLSSAVPPYIF